MTQAVELLRRKFSSIYKLEVSNRSRSKVLEKLDEAAIDILNIVGHDRDNIFPDIGLVIPQNVRDELGYGIVYFSAIAARSAASPPHVAVEIQLEYEEPADEEVARRIGRHMLALDAASKCNYSVLLTNTYIAILGKEYPPKVYLFSEFGETDASNILNQLEPPESYPKGLGGKFPPGHHPNQTKLTRWLFTDAEISPEYRGEIETPNFSLNIDTYSDMLYDAYSAESTREKGDSLEDVAEFLFQGLSMLKVRDRNLRTRSGEIDLVLEYDGANDLDIFSDYSRFALVECKNVGDSVSSKEVGYFKEKLRRTDTDLGFLIAWNGISGEETGDDAQRVVNSSDSSDPYIVVLDSEDLYSILDGKSLYKIIDENLYALRFDLK